MTDFTIKVGDDRTVLKATLYNPSGSVTDLSYSMVQFILTSDTGVKLTKTATVQDAPNGLVWVKFDKSDFNNIQGYCKGEFKCTFNDGRIESWPNDSYINVRVVKSL